MFVCVFVNFFFSNVEVFVAIVFIRHSGNDVVDAEKVARPVKLSFFCRKNAKYCLSA